MRQSLHKSQEIQAKPAAVQKNAQAKKTRHCIQARLTIGQPNDQYEQEADRVADQVVNSSANPQPLIQRKCRDSEQKVRLQTKPSDQTSQSTPVDIEQSIQQSRGSGSPLSPSARSFMESKIGADFGQVRIHTDSTAHKLSAKLNAQAFASGNDIYFNKGKFNPETRSGKHLLAHELTHTVQQRASVQKKIQKQDQPQSSDNSKLILKDQAHIESILKDAFSRNYTTINMTWEKTSGGLIVGYEKLGKAANNAKKGGEQFTINEVRTLVRMFYSASNKYADLYFTRGNNGWTFKYKPRPLPKPKVKVVSKPKPKKIVRTGKLEERIAVRNYPGWIKVDGHDFFGKVRELPHFIRVKDDHSGTKLIVDEGRYKGQVAAYKSSYPDKKSRTPGDRKVNTEWSFVYSKHRPPARLTVIYTKDLGNRAGHILTEGKLLGVGSPIRFVTETGNPVPKGTHDIEIPDYQHNKTLGNSPHGSTWFRLGHSGDRYLHPGTFSQGCITVLNGARAWEPIYQALIEARKDDKSVGTMRVIDSRKKP